MPGEGAGVGVGRWTLDWKGGCAAWRAIWGAALQPGLGRCHGQLTTRDTNRLTNGPAHAAPAAAAAPSRSPS